MKLKILIRTGMVLVMLGTLYMIWVIGEVTWNQYQDTRQWQKTAYTGELKDVEPMFAKNYVNRDDAIAVEIWQQLEDALQEINKNEKVVDTDVARYEDLLNKSIEQQEKYQLETGDVVRNNQRMRLYLDLEKQFPTVYEVPAVKELENLTTRLYALNLEEPQPVDSIYFDRLQTIANDYQNVSVFLRDFLPKLGLIENQVLIVDKQVGEKTTNTIVTELEEKKLRKFPFLDDLYDLLSSNDWSNVLKRNQITRAYDTWKAAELELTQVRKTDFFAAADILTYQDALDAGLTVEIREWVGYEIDKKSPVAQIRYNGMSITKDQFIRIGTPVIVTLTEKYIKVEEPDDPQEMENEDEDDVEEPSEPSTNHPTQKPDNWEDDWDERPNIEKPDKPNNNWTDDW